MRVVVAYNDDADGKRHLNEVERAGEKAVVETAREIAGVLGAELLPVRDVRAALDRLRFNRPDLVFNLCEGVAGQPRWEMHFALALEMLGIAFTGCDPIALGICGDKPLTKQLLAVAGVPTPVNRGQEWPPHSRWIVKPAHEDAGIGIDRESVCACEADVERRSRHILKTYGQPAVVEEFIEGREFNQAFFHSRDGIAILPPGEIIFANELKAEERVVGWKAKWAAGSNEDRMTVNRTPAVVTEALRNELAALTRDTATALSLGGYGRLDVRQRASTGELFVLDVNPNPDIGRDSGFRKALAAAGIAFPDFLDELMMTSWSSRRP